MAYKWTPGSRLSGDADTVGEQLEQIRKDHRGRLEAADVVRVAKRKRSSALGRLFEWDETRAATRHWEEHARYIIRSVIVVQIHQQYDRPVRAFVQIEKDDASYYTSIAHVMSEADLREQFLERALKEMEDWAKRYADFQELAGVFAAIDKVVPIRTVATKKRVIKKVMPRRKVAIA